MGWLRMLGAVELLADDDEPLLPTGAARMRRLLALLALRAGGTVSVDTAAEVVWGADQPEHPDAAVQSLVSRLRRLLDGDPDLDLATRPGGYRLEIRDGHLDAARFEQLAAQGSTLLDEDPAEAADLLDRALMLWPGGEAFGDLRDDEPFHTRAAQLDEIRAQAVEDLVGADLRRGRHHEAAARLEALVVEAPLRERRRAQLVLARHRAGRTAEALAAYQEYRAQLVDELGVEPSAPFRALHEGILRDDPALSWHPPAAPTPGGPEAAGPPPLPSEHDLLGRDELLDDVTAAVAAGELVTLTGPGGVGKSSLAHAVAERLAGRLPDGAHVVELASVTSPLDVVLAVASAVDVPLGPSGDARDRVVGWLARQQALLVLDNCEHLLDPVASLVERLRRRAPRLRVLLTSQSAVGIPGEHLVGVAPLAVEGPGGETGPAVELFVARARAHDAAFALTPDTIDDVVAVCRHLDGLPLAVELAAARMRAMTPGELATRLSGRFRLLHGGSRTAGDRHRTLRSLVDWSYGLLEPGLQRAFDVLSVFAGDFSLEHAETLLPRALADDGLDDGGATDLVLTLVERSMLVRTPGEPTTYRLLETLRAYGRERLRARAVEDDVRDAHARWVANLVGGTREDIFTSRHARDAALVARALDEMRAAVAWSSDRDPSTAAAIVAGGAGMVELRMNPEVPHWADTLLAGPLAAPGHGVPDDLTAWVYAVSAAGARFAADLDVCEAHARRAATLAEDLITRGYTSYLLVEAAIFRGDLAGARHRLDEATRLLPLGLSPGWRAHLGVMQALDAAYSGHDTDAALRLSEQTLADAIRQDLPLAEAWATYARGEVILEDDPGAAAPYLEQAVQQAEGLGDRYLGGVALLSLASARARSGDTGAAATLFRRAVAHWRRSGNWTHQWATLRNAVVLLARSGLWHEAAWLDGALAARGVWGQAAGVEAERASQVRDELVAQLGRPAYDDATHRGAGTNDGELVEMVLGQLAAVAAAQGRGGTQSSR